MDLTALHRCGQGVAEPAVVSGPVLARQSGQLCLPLQHAPRLLDTALTDSLDGEVIRVDDALVITGQLLPTLL